MDGQKVFWARCLGAMLLAATMLLAQGCRRSARVGTATAAGFSDNHLFADDVNQARQADISRLRASHPALVADYEQSIVLSEQDHFAQALAAATRVHEAAPEFAPALRRMCHAATGLGASHHDEGIAHCRAAVRLEPNSTNQIALATNLLGPTPGATPASAVAEAKQLIFAALQQPGSKLFAQTASCELAQHLVLTDVADAKQLFAQCSGALMQLAPNSNVALYYAVINAALHDDPEGAHRYVDRMAQLGLPAASVAALRDAIEEGRSTLSSAKKFGTQIVFNVLIPWFLGLFGLLCFGTILSRLTLRYATNATQREKPSTAESILLRSYRALIGISSVYYYLSLPLVLLFVLAVCGAVLLGVLLLGVVPIKLVVILGMVVVGSLAAVLKSFWIKTVEIAPGELIDCTNHPVLSKMLDELGQTLQTARPTKIYLTQGAEAAVYEEGGVWAHLRGKSTRCLIIGLALVEGLTMDELRSILAHEYGHFRNKDTAGGHLALSVRRAMFRTINVLIEHGVGNMSPLWWFTQGYYKLFMRISQGASRLQEILADRTAAQTCGSNVFASALKRSIEQANRFDLSVDSVLNDAFAGKYAISNLYAQARVAEIDGSKIEALTTEEIARLPSVYDSHPSPQQRIALVNSLNFAQATESDTRPASEIFSNGFDLQLKMTKTILDSIEARTGKDLSAVSVPAALPH